MMVLVINVAAPYVTQYTNTMASMFAITPRPIFIVSTTLLCSVSQYRIDVSHNRWIVCITTIVTL